MDIDRAAAAGTMESSDVYIMATPASELIIEIRSPNLEVYGAKMRQSLEEIIAAKGIKSGRFIVDDRGALDCTLRARAESVIEASLKASSKAAVTEAMFEASPAEPLSPTPAPEVAAKPQAAPSAEELAKAAAEISATSTAPGDQPKKIRTKSTKSLTSSQRKLTRATNKNRRSGR